MKTSYVSVGYFLQHIYYTRPKPVEHGYVFMYGSRYYWEMVETGPFFVRRRTVDWGGGSFFK